MLLKDKNTIMYGAGGSLGGAAAKAFAAAGATVFLTGRNIASVQKIADEIIAAGGKAEADEVDGLDEGAIKRHLDTVVDKAGNVDISFNAVGIDVVQGIALATMKMVDFVTPGTNTLQTRFLTATAAAR